MMGNKNSAIVLLGGYLSEALFYDGFSRRLASLAGRKVFVVDTRSFDWIPSISKLGWYHLLYKLDRTVKNAYEHSNGEKLTLIGHSQGGILGRLYLSSEPFLGTSFSGCDYIDHLIMLGCPHLNRGGIERGGPMARWVQKRVPNSTFSPQVRYTSVAGKHIRGCRSGLLSERFAFKVYKDICGDGDVWGDGIVPISSALLPGSEQIVLENASHYAIVGQTWYGSESVMQDWWR